MAERTLADEIITIVKSVSNNNPPPETVTIAKAYDDNHVDVEFTNGGKLNYIPSNTKGSKNDIGVCVYLNGDITNPFIILAGKSGDTPSGDYVTEEELNTILASYVTINFANTTYANKMHTHSQYITREEIHDLDIDLSTIELVPYSENPNGVICFDNLGENLYIKKSNTSGLVKNDGTIDTTHYLSSLPSHNHDDRYYTESEVDSALNGKQATLVSGTNIKTINNQSILGSGNIDIQGGGGSVIGTGSFSINSNGHLIVELPNGVDNPYFINNNGHLIYDTSNTHNEE